MTASGTIYFVDRENHRVRMVDGSGVIATLAGTGSFGYSGDGGGTSAVVAETAVFPVVFTSIPGEVTLLATATDLVEATGSFTTVPGLAAQLDLVYDDARLPNDGEGTLEITVRVIDAFGNLVSSDSGIKVLLTVSGSGTGTDSATVNNGNHTFLITSGVTPGLLLFEVSSDGLSEATGRLSVRGVPPELVVVTDSEGPSEVFRDETYTVLFEVGNQGDGPIIDPFVVDVFLVGDSDSLKMGSKTVNEFVDVDSTVSAEASFTLPSFSFVSFTQTFRWVVQLDVEDDVSESEEGNNHSAGNPVGFPLISIPQDTLLFGTVILGERGVRTLDVSNTGLAPLSFTITMPDCQIVVFPDSVSNLEPGQTRILALSYSPAGGESFTGWVKI